MRMATSVRLAAIGALALCRTTSAQKPPPVHLLDRPIASSQHEFREVGVVRQLPNGNLLVNDALRRQLLLLDTSLKTLSVVADSTPGSTNPYGMAFGGLVASPGDSSIFILPRVPSMYVIDPAGKVARVVSVPRPQDVFSMASSSNNGVPGIDAKGRWVYRGATPPATRPTLTPGGPPGWMIGADSAPIVRYDAATHILDTISTIKISQLKAKMYPGEDGTTRGVIENNPVQVIDNWAVLSDGSVAIVRGQDYHVDLINPDGSVTREPKVAYAWEPLSDDGKSALLDSLRKADEDSRKNSGPPKSITGARSAGGGSSTSASGSSGAAGVGPPSGDRPPGEFPALNELPDYRPPFGQNAVRSDADGNLWIKTTHHEPSAGFVYDVVTRQGKVVDRVQLQPGRSIVGFGRGGIVYMVAGEGSTAWLEKAKWNVP
jgi:hypothetical protein